MLVITWSPQSPQAPHCTSVMAEGTCSPKARMFSAHVHPGVAESIPFSRKGRSHILRSEFISHHLIYSMFKYKSDSVIDPWRRRARCGQAPGRPIWRRPAPILAWGSWVVPPKAAKHRTRYKRPPRVLMVERDGKSGAGDRAGQNASLDCRVRLKRCSPAHIQNPLCKPSCSSAWGSEVDSALTQAHASKSAQPKLPFHRHREEDLKRSHATAPPAQQLDPASLKVQAQSPDHAGAMGVLHCPLPAVQGGSGLALKPLPCSRTSLPGSVALTSCLTLSTSSRLSPACLAPGLQSAGWHRGCSRCQPQHLSEATSFAQVEQNALGNYDDANVSVLKNQ